MLSVYLGRMEEAVYYPPVYFDNRYEDEWITDKQSVEIIRDVDKSDVVSAHLIESPVLGPISPKELSGGVKTILLMDDTGRIFNIIYNKNSPTSAGSEMNCRSEHKCSKEFYK